MQNFGANRKEGYAENMAKPNAMYGIYMRLSLMIQDLELKKVKEECLAYFSKMASRTGTLWEHNNISASLNHGFASYIATWLTQIYTGYNKGTFCDEYLGEDCTFVIPQSNKTKLKVAVKNKERTIEKVL